LTVTPQQFPSNAASHLPLHSIASLLMLVMPVMQQPTLLVGATFTLLIFISS
jgi:hypothetical protein